MLFSISMRKTESFCESIFFVTFGSCEKIEVKRGHLVKKWELGQTKKISLYQFEIQGFEILGLAPTKALNPWISDDKYQIWATFRRKLTIGHKKIDIVTKFSLFDQVATFDLDFLASPEGYKKKYFQGVIPFFS